MANNRNSRVLNKAIELFATMLGQAIAESHHTPVDTGLMRSTFQNTVRVVENSKGKVIRFTTPFYTDYVHEGTARIQARRFIIQVLNEKGEFLLKRSFQIADKSIN